MMLMCPIVFRLCYSIQSNLILTHFFIELELHERVILFSDMV